MMKTTMAALVAVCLLGVGPLQVAQGADDSKPQRDHAPQSFPAVALDEILGAVSKESGKTFLVDARVPSEVVVGQPRARDVDYSLLLKVLRNNGLAAVSSGNTVSIVPVATIRQYPLPLLPGDDESIDDEEWVTRVIPLENADAVLMVPMFRPLLPQQGHLAAISVANALIIVDRYANVRRVTKIVLEIDKHSPAPQE